MPETTPKAPEVKEQTKSERLMDLFNKTVDAIKKSADARKAADPSKDMVEMDEKAKEQFEAPKVSWEKAFDLGKFEINQDEVKKLPEIADDKVYMLLGSVDRTTFNKNIKRENREVDRYTDGTKVKWYQALKDDAALFIKLKDGIETNFPQLADIAKKDKMVQIITDMSQMTDFTDAAWSKMIADKGYTDAEIYGAEGAYNIMLSFQRAIAPIDREKLEEGENVVIGQNEKNEDIKVSKYTIRLEVASKKGNRGADRFSKLVEVEMKKEEEEEVPAPPTPEPAPEPTPPTPEPAPEPAPPEPEPEPELYPPELEEIEESPDVETLERMIQELNELGFELVTFPINFGDSGYAKYGEKRIDITFAADGVYNFKMLNTPENVTVEADSVDGQTMKAQLDAQEHANKVEALKLDLEHIAGFNSTVEGPLDKDPDGAPYDPDTYKVTLKDLIYKNPGTGDQSDPFNVEFIVHIDERRGYVDGETVGGTKLKKADDPKTLYEEAMEKGYKEQNVNQGGK